jgi:hypothetical protein
MGNIFKDGDLWHGIYFYYDIKLNNPLNSGRGVFILKYLHQNFKFINHKHKYIL